MIWERFSPSRDSTSFTTVVGSSLRWYCSCRLTLLSCRPARPMPVTTAVMVTKAAIMAERRPFTERRDQKPAEDWGREAFLFSRRR